MKRRASIAIATSLGISACTLLFPTSHLDEGPAAPSTDASPEASADDAGDACTMCGADCVQLDVDPNNCGTCGVVCVGPDGVCTGGLCDTFDIMKPVAVPQAIVVDATNIYWLVWNDPNSIIYQYARASLTLRKDTSTVYLRVPHKLTGLVEDQRWLYTLQNDDLGNTHIDRSSTNPDAGNALSSWYFAPGKGNAIEAFAIESGVGAILTRVLSAPTARLATVVDGNATFFPKPYTTTQTGPLTIADGRIWFFIDTGTTYASLHRVYDDLDGGDGTPFAVAQNAPTSMTARNGVLYWAANKIVESAPTDGGADRNARLGDTMGNGNAIVADDNYVWICTSTDVQRAPITGGAFVTVARFPQSDSCALAIAGGAIPTLLFSSRGGIRALRR